MIWVAVTGINHVQYPLCCFLLPVISDEFVVLQGMLRLDIIRLGPFRKQKDLEFLTN
jgi:hypothetical protein